jgi:RimJ/RimL family protein N-acetyltransferase
MPDHIRIRPATPEDAARIAEIDLLPEVRPWMDLPRAADGEEDAWVRANVAWITKASHQCVVATLADGTVVGSITLAHEPGEEEGVCMGLAVHPAFQAQGIGRGLLRWLLDTADALDLSRVYLAVHKDNHRAITLYALNGFVYDGTTPTGCDRMVRRRPG